MLRVGAVAGDHDAPTYIPPTCCATATKGPRRRPERQDGEERGGTRPRNGRSSGRRVHTSAEGGALYQRTRQHTLIRQETRCQRRGCTRCGPWKGASSSQNVSERTRMWTGDDSRQCPRCRGASRSPKKAGRESAPLPEVTLKGHKSTTAIADDAVRGRRRVVGHRRDQS